MPADSLPIYRSRPEPASHGDTAGRANEAADVARRLRQALYEATQLHRALAASRRQTEAARQEIERLGSQVSRLTQELKRLSRREARARRLAYRDELTGLPNRRVLLDRLRQAIAQTTRHGRHVALLMVDLDGFKSVNDRLGHTGGDALLQAVAERLTGCVRAGDTVCRYGGDEFVVLLPEIADRDAAIAVERKIRTALSAAYVVDGTRITGPASIGTAVYPVDGRNCRDLIARADVAMYGAKADRKFSAGSRVPPGGHGTAR